MINQTNNTMTIQQQHKARRDEHDAIKKTVFLLIEELDEYEKKEIAIFAISKTLNPEHLTKQENE